MCERGERQRKKELEGGRELAGPRENEKENNCVVGEERDTQSEKDTDRQREHE